MPNPGQYNRSTFQKDKNSFYRSTMLKAHFGSDNQFTYNGTTPKSDKEWLPKNTHHSVKSYIEAVNNDIENENNPSNKNHNNLTKGELAALKSFMNREDIIITQADKGGGVCIISLDDYIKEAKKQLEDTSFYVSLPINPTFTHSNIINNTIRKFATDKLFRKM